MIPENAIKIREDNLAPRLQQLTALIDATIKSQFENGSLYATYDEFTSYKDLIPNVMQHYTKLGWCVKHKDNDWDYNAYLIFYTEKPASLLTWLTKLFNRKTKL